MYVFSSGDKPGINLDYYYMNKQVTLAIVK